MKRRKIAIALSLAAHAAVLVGATSWLIGSDASGELEGPHVRHRPIPSPASILDSPPQARLAPRDVAPPPRARQAPKPSGIAVVATATPVEPHRWLGKGRPTRETEAAVQDGLRWLARHQCPDGGWSAGVSSPWSGCTCEVGGNPDFDTGATALAVLAFLGRGQTPSNRASYIDPVTGRTMRIGETVRKGLKFLIEHQDQDGLVGPPVSGNMRPHAIAALALAEAYGITNAVSYRAPAQKAIMHLHDAQIYKEGWGVSPRSRPSDHVVTAWGVLALKGAQISGLDVSQTAFDGALASVASVSTASAPSEAAIALLTRIFVVKRRDDSMESLGEVVADDLPEWNPISPRFDHSSWQFEALALFQHDGPRGELWERWSDRMAATLCEHERRREDGCAFGSWAVDGKGEGLVESTAMCVLTLESYYRYDSVFGSAARRREGKAR